MTSSSEPVLERGLDTMLLVYSLLQGHPAQAVCEQFLRNHCGWFTSTVNLFETHAVLTKVYSVAPALAVQKVQQVASGPVAICPLDQPTALAALQLAETHRIDLTDAVLLHTTCTHSAAGLATDDASLTRACHQTGIAILNPVDAALRQQVAGWESVNLPARGLPRILRRVHEWLGASHVQAALDFWSATGGGSHLP